MARRLALVVVVALGAACESAYPPKSERHRECAGIVTQLYAGGRGYTSTRMTDQRGESAYRFHRAVMDCVHGRSALDEHSLRAEFERRTRGGEIRCSSFDCEVLVETEVELGAPRD